MLPAMTSDWRSVEMPGVLRRTVDVSADGRGAFSEVWRDSWTQPTGVTPFVQANVSRSAAGVLRGLHFHLHQVDLWIVLEGRAHLSLVDIRDLLMMPPGDLQAQTAAGDRRRTHSEQLTAGDQVLIPEGIAHGFWALEPVVLLYLVTNEYDGSDEQGFAWDDPAAGAPWPSTSPILSDRDANAPSMLDAVAAAQASGQISRT